MDIGGFEIIEEKLQSSMTGSWTEYLCLNRNTDNEYELSVKGYMVLGDLQDFYNEEKEDYDIPNEIDGWDVVTVESGLIVGGPLVDHSEDLMPIIFQSLTEPEVIEWLQHANRYKPAILEKIRSAMVKSSK